MVDDEMRSRRFGEARRRIEITCRSAVWHDTGKPPLPIRWALIRDPLDKFKPQALLCTDQQATAKQIAAWLVRRWQVKVTFHEVRTHLGVETQHQWSDAGHRPHHAWLAGFCSR
jgi:hypothetical protein